MEWFDIVTTDALFLIKYNWPWNDLEMTLKLKIELNNKIASFLSLHRLYISSLKNKAVEPKIMKIW